MTVRRRCDGFVSVEAFYCEPDSRARVCMVPDVTDVPVSPSSVVTELCDVSSCCSCWKFVEPQSLSFSKKQVWTATQEEMRYED